MWNITSSAPGGEASCPACEFSFATHNELALGSCLSAFDAAIGFDADASAMSFAYYWAGYYFELGPFSAALTEAPYYNRLDWGGYSFAGPYYYGTFYLY